jgi:hypothetical protein
MRTIPRAYEKGEFILICYLPIMVIVTFLISTLQNFSPVLTYNHAFLIKTALHLMLASALVLIFIDIENVSEKRLKTTDWYIRIIVFLFLIGTVFLTLGTLVNIVMMTFSTSPTFESVRQHAGYGGMMKQLLRAAVMFAGAWIWLKGINKGHAVLAISGMVIVMLINPPDSYVQSKFRQMKHQEMESISITSEQSPTDEMKGEEQKGVKQSAPKTHPSFVVGSDKIEGLWFPFHTPRLYGIALMLFTLVRYQKPKEQLE